MDSPTPLFLSISSMCDIGLVDSCLVCRDLLLLDLFLLDESSECAPANRLMGLNRPGIMAGPAEPELMNGLGAVIGPPKGYINWLGS